MKVLFSCLIILVSDLAVLSEAWFSDFCKDSDNVAFIVNKDTSDHLVYSAQRNFLMGLTDRIRNRRTKISMVVFDRKVQGGFGFQAAFLNVTKKNFTPDMLYERPRPFRKIQNAAELFPYLLDVYNPNRGLLIISLDVQFPPSFYLKPYQMFYSDPSTKFGSNYMSYLTLYKVYEFFIKGSIDVQFNRRYYYYGHGDIHSIITAQSKDILSFQYNFEILYGEICHVHSVSQPELESSENYFRLFECNTSNCLLQTYWTSGFQFQFSQTRFTFVRQEKGGDITMACSKEGMTPFTVRSKTEARFIGNALTSLLSTLKMESTDPMLINFGLVRRKNTIGHRFAWLNGKDLSFSHWAPGEPKGNDIFGCAHWIIYKKKQADVGWSSVECGQAGLQYVFCHNEPPPKTKSLDIIENYETYVGDESKKYGEVYFDGNPQKRVKVSLTIAISSGFIHRKLQEANTLQLQGYLHNEFISISYEEKESFTAELDKLFHICDGGNSYRGVPYSQVCDGIRDCSSGSDEAECEKTGYPDCSLDEFSCSSGQCIPYKTRCDLIKDCHDGSDEDGCSWECQHRSCLSGRCLPKSWFHDGQPDCRDGSDEHEVHGEPCVLTCNRTQCVTGKQLNDGVLDCQGPEGPLDETLGALQSFTCPQNDRYFFTNNWAPRCVLYHDIFQEIIGCRDFSHLENCSNFSCPSGYAKCPDSFCIPIAYLNDGKEDCDYGEDEAPQRLENSSDLFMCHPERSQYLPISSVCDGRRDCFNGGDEIDCDLTCFPGFICLAGTVSATRYKKDQAPPNWSFISPRVRYVDISGVHVPNYFNSYPKYHFSFLLSLNLSSCGINGIQLSDKIEKLLKSKSGFKDFQAIRTLDLSHNKIEIIGDNSVLKIMHRIKILDLSYNEKLTKVGTFQHMKNLNTIDLSFTGINKLDRHAFLSLGNLKKISLKQTRITVVDFVLPAGLSYFDVEQTQILNVGRDVFKNAQTFLKEIRSSSFKVCCAQVLGSSIPRQLCKSLANEIIFSCDDLVEEQLLRIILWLVGSTTLVGNIITLVYRLTWDRKLLLQSYGLFVTNLGVSDTLMGCYLAIIAAADFKFQGEYVLHDHSWRTSGVCLSAGTIATLSSLTSTLFVFLITVDRYLVVRFPFGEVRFDKKSMTAAVSIVWILGMCLAVVPLLPFAETWEIYSTNGMCLGLPLRAERLPGWQYTVFLFVGFNFVLFILIGAGQIAIFKKVKASKRKTTQKLNRKSQLFQNQQREEIAIAKKLALVVVSNFICWFPIITLGIVTLFGVDVGATAYRWSAVLILPINSALNPLLYTLPAIKTRFNNYREAHKSIKATKRRTTKSRGSNDSNLKLMWLDKVQTIKSMRWCLQDRNDSKIWTMTELETLFKKLEDVKEVC